MGRGAREVLGPSGHYLSHQGYMIELGQVMTHELGLDAWVGCLVVLSFTQQTFVVHAEVF